MPAPYPFGKDLEVYWNRLSPKEKQLSFDEEGLRSFVPLLIGFQLARQIKSEIVYDCFSGVGGLSIAFAAAGKTVHGIELNAHRVKLAQANAKTFGVEDKTDFICAEVISALGSMKLKDHALILDPPWGGTAYGELPSFELKHFRPNGVQLLSVAFKTEAEILFMLPKNFDLNELNQFTRPRLMIENILNGELIGYSALFPAAKQHGNEQSNSISSKD
jgi:16S rRNA G966 N2-methylase RsmD